MIFDALPPLQVHPVAYPLLEVCAWLIGSGYVFIIILGLIRRPDAATYKNDWIRLTVMFAIGLANVILGALGPLGLVGGAAVVTFLAWRELLDCVRTRFGDAPSGRWLPAIAALSIAFAVTGDAFAALLGIACAAWIGATGPMLLTGKPVPMATMMSIGLGSVLVSVPIAHVILLVDLNFGVFALLVVLINCLDGFSAGFGRLLGKHPLCPQISPGKTVEGALGGLFSCILVGYLASFLVPEWSPLERAIASSLVAIFALLGDLVASSLKREAGIKDFSQALPGMGGILDRFDGLLFSAPVLYAYVRLTGAM